MKTSDGKSFPNKLEKVENPMHLAILLLRKDSLWLCTKQKTPHGR
jgi:hypothetical protein